MLFCFYLSLSLARALFLLNFCEMFVSSIRLRCGVAPCSEVRDPSLEEHPKVQELRNLSKWSEGHVWVSPEMHGCITGVFKNQIDWLPLNTGSVRPTQATGLSTLAAS